MGIGNSPFKIDKAFKILAIFQLDLINKSCLLTYAIDRFSNLALSLESLDCEMCNYQAQERSRSEVGIVFNGKTIYKLLTAQKATKIQDFFNRKD